MLKSGDRVKFPTERPKSHSYYSQISGKEITIKWDDNLDILLGKEASVISIIEDNIVLLDIDLHLGERASIYSLNWFTRIWPPEKPSILYKYRRFDTYGLKLLNDQELYFAAPFDFNDPLDCKISASLALSKRQIIDNKNTVAELHRFKKYISYLSSISTIDDELINELYRFENQLSNLDVNDEVACLNFYCENTTTLQKVFDLYFHHFIDKIIGVFSTTIRYDIPLMWSHYAESHRGFCIGFNFDQLKSDLPESNGGFVQYVDHYPKIGTEKQVELLNSFILTHYKTHYWSYEQEFRITKLYTNNSNAFSRIEKISESAFSEIIVGIKVSNEDLKFALKRGEVLKIPVYKIVREQDSFNFEKELIN